MTNRQGPDFDPGDFIGAASDLLATNTTESNSRAAATRLYYAVYGRIRERVCGAKKTTPRKLFGKAGRHKDVAKAVSLSKPFQPITAAYNGLMVLRVRSDYHYHMPVDHKAVRGSVGTAQWVLNRLDTCSDADYKGLLISKKKK